MKLTPKLFDNVIWLTLLQVFPTICFSYIMRDVSAKFFSLRRVGIFFCRNVRRHVFAETSFAETSFAETSFAETSEIPPDLLHISVFRSYCFRSYVVELSGSCVTVVCFVEFNDPVCKI